MHFVRRSFNLSALLGRDENCIALLWKNLQKIDKKQVEQNYMMQWCIPGTFDFWILQFFIYNIYLSVISSEILITLLVEFPRLNHWLVLAFRMFSVFGFPYTCWISSITFVCCGKVFFHSCSKREFNSLKTWYFRVRWANTRAKPWLLQLIYFENRLYRYTKFWRLWYAGWLVCSKSKFINQKQFHGCASFNVLVNSWRQFLQCGHR